MAKESKMRTALRAGCIAEWYTMKGYFVKIYPAFSIDKVKFSFVEKGNNGNGFDVYVDAMAFSLLCDDIRSGAMRRRIAEDQGQYPAAWKYVTGENATKEVAIGKSNNGGIVVQGRDKGKKLNAFVPLTDYDALRSMQELFDLLAGKRGPQDRYMKSLSDLFWDTQGERDKWFRNGLSDEDECVVPPGYVEEPAAPSAEPDTGASNSWPYADPQIPDGVKRMTATFLAEPTPISNDGRVLQAPVSTQGGKQGKLYLSANTAAARMDEIRRAVREQRAITIGFGIMTGTDGQPQVWFVA